MSNEGEGTYAVICDAFWHGCVLQVALVLIIQQPNLNNRQACIMHLCPINKHDLAALLAVLHTPLQAGLLHARHFLANFGHEQRQYAVYMHPASCYLQIAQP